MHDFISKDAGPNERRDALLGAGRKFFASAPERFRAVFWRIIDENLPLRTIAVVSDDPAIPWELMVPNRVRGGKEQRLRPLGVEYVVGRWLREDRSPPPAVSPLKNAWVLAPQYSGTERLANSAAESTFVCASFAGEEITPARYDRFNEALAEREATLLHFVCHGSSAAGGSQEILLEARQKLHSYSLADMSCVRQACEHEPFIFINACEVGRQVLGLAGVEGFAFEFMKLGAAAVVAPLWDVEYTVAHDVAQRFYAAVLEAPTKPFAEILSEIRDLAYQDVDEGSPESSSARDTYAAYAFYGDPRAARQHAAT